ncbi:acyltransferase [uncultured Sphingomonas sp.]|uniref:acyltransferase family protein n=1 Tax=uncultured Sphingomonas sp. TaxID=158754 RepID=UPI0025E8DF2F|nr:acyltransferase [uncultured Sphingomonas sp.]
MTTARPEWVLKRRDVSQPPVSARAEKRVDFIDTLRCVAASAVVMQHVCEGSDVPLLRHLTDFSPGVFGVVLFFLVSGFVMPISVRGGLEPVSFALRRVFRIYPALLFAFALWAMVDLMLGGGGSLVRRASVGAWVANLLLVQDFVGMPAFLGVTWTLILEFGWYGLFALSWRRLSGRSGSFLAVAMPLGMVALVLVSLVTGTRLPLGRVGMIYAAITGFQACRWFMGEIGNRPFGASAASFLIVMAGANAVSFGYFRHPAISFGQSFWPWLIAPVLFLAALLPPVRRSRVMNNRVLAWLGSISLSIYLLHPIAMALCAGVTPDLAKIGFTLAVTLALSWACFQAIERPGIALGRRLARRHASRSPRGEVQVAGGQGVVPG